MATRLDIGEQEQLDQLKDFWKAYGNLITWVLILALGGFAAFNGWQWLQRDRAQKAAVLYDQLDKAVQAGDAERTTRVFTDLKERYGSTTYAEQAGLAAAKLLFGKGQLDAARVNLQWVAENANQGEYRVIASLRLAGLLLDEKKYDEALKQLPADAPPAFAGLVADRRGDILNAQGKTEEAKAAYRTAWEVLPPTIDYRRLVEAKLTALGAPPNAGVPVLIPAPVPGGASQ
ncbi:MAG: tetratricopeptide repeat protein [Methylibium sp.]|uniref:YfgM family protein n=1 Tax=Methylibium sp. TaxID=2067992 RepID=UPI0017C97574|nr:tetratricopeptide repeat protein [Methylibium sp.]MBA3597580.1 tetratricopeptide repeat protein [Methylibium sp.]